MVLKAAAYATVLITPSSDLLNMACKVAESALSEQRPEAAALRFRVGNARNVVTLSWVSETPEGQTFLAVECELGADNWDEFMADANNAFAHDRMQTVYQDPEMTVLIGWTVETSKLLSRAIRPQA